MTIDKKKIVKNAVNCSVQNVKNDIQTGRKGNITRLKKVSQKSGPSRRSKPHPTPLPCEESGATSSQRFNESGKMGKSAISTIKSIKPYVKRAQGYVPVEKSNMHKKLFKKERPKLAPGTEISCHQSKYTVVQLLGSGGFGDVYKVKKAGKDLFYAMKTELNIFNNRRIDRLRIEAAIMNACMVNSDPKKRDHFAKMIDRGKTELFKLVVMDLLGPSIDDIRRHILCTEFTKSTAVRISEQALQGIWDFHLVGYIHKDIKPQNFAIGLKDKENCIYILDFGIARRFIDKRTKTVRKPRENVKFMGTVRYASRNCHMSKELCRRDDLESWIYMSMELHDSEILPWKRVTDRQLVLTKKIEFFSCPNMEMYNKVSHGYRRISKYVNELTYEQNPEYAFVMGYLSDIIKDEHIDINAPLDWIGKPLERKDKPPENKEKEAKEKEKPKDTRETADVGLFIDPEATKDKQISVDSEFVFKKDDKPCVTSSQMLQSIGDGQRSEYF